ncbi:MAG: transcription termination factor Rho [Eubacterium sp.]|nr:transcription termination factor Rho [Eubacterium sp.]
MDYKKMKVAELRALAEEKGIRGTKEMKKNDLVELLMNIEKMQKKTDSDEAKTSEDKTAQKENVQKKAVKKKSAGKESAGKNTAQKTSQKTARKANSSKKNVKDIKDSADIEKKVEADIKKEAEPVFIKNNEQKAGQDSLQMASSEEELEVGGEPSDASTDDALQEQPEKTQSNIVAEGILEVLSDGYGFIRSDNYMPGEKDIYVSPSQIRKFRLRTGDIVRGPIRLKSNPNEKFSALLYIESVNSYSPSEILKRKKFEDMTPIFPNERIHLDYSGAPVSLRIVDLFSPIGKGQRGMIVSPPKAGKTTLLKQIAKRISVAYPDMNLIVLLIDERPEEVTDIKESIEGPNAEVIYSTFDELPEHHKRVSEMVIERAKRLVESGNDVVILIDSITRLSRAYNLTVPPSGRTLSGGLDPAALHMPKKFFGAARNMREGGSLTILATALIDTGSRMDDVVFEEFKGTGNMELVLDRNLQEKRVFPAIDISKSGTRKDNLLLSQDETEVLDLIHARFHSLKAEDVTEDLLKIMSKTENNKQFIAVTKKLFQRKS